MKMVMVKGWTGLGVAAVLLGCANKAEPPEVPTTQAPVTTNYHGVQVTDPYQWLENGADPAVRTWTEAQNQCTRAYLDKLPDRPAIERKLKGLFERAAASYSSLQVCGRTVFALKFKPPAQQPILVRLRSPNDAASEQTVLDPNQLDPTGATSIDFYVPSPDARLVAVSLSQHGSEAGTLHFFDVETGREVGERIPRVQFPTAGGSVAWAADSAGVFYTRYPAPGERPPEESRFYQQVYFHKLGTPVAQDTYEIGQEFPRIAEIDLQTGPAGHVLASVANGDGGQVAHWLRGLDGQWRQITRFEDEIKHVEFGRDPLYIELPRDESLYLLSRRNAPNGRILRVPLAEPDLSRAQEVVPEGTNTIQTFRAAASGLYVVELVGGPALLRFYDWAAWPSRLAGATPGPSAELGHDTLPEEEAEQSAETEQDDSTGQGGGAAAAEAGPVSGGLVHGRVREVPLRGWVAVPELLVRRGDELLFRMVSFTEPATWYVYDPRSPNRITATQLRGRSPAPFYDVEVVRVFATSKDGTRVPMNIIQRKGTRLDGTNPTILYGYGGYGISLSPNFDFTRRVWLDQGGVFVVANLRGGGEYGEAWHQAGMLTRKQNVFDDFIACAEWLVRSNYTRPDKLAIWGASNGGLLVGAALTQRPDLFRAAVAQVGIFDMLRFELDPNGTFNATEFGSVRDPEQFKALYAYSPYHRVRNGTVYPAVFLLAGEHDGRVNPAHSRKMAARLQAASRSGRPVLLQVSSRSGHGLGTALEERIAQLTDVYAFLMDQLGIEYSLIERGPWAGGVTPTSAVVKARLAEPGLTARLVVSKSPLFRRPLYFGPVVSETNHYNIVRFELTGLEPDTLYHYALEINGRLDRRHRGQFRSFPDGPASFTFAFASCARTGSTSDIFDVIRRHRPLFFMNTGDFHYQDIGTNDLARYLDAYDRVLASPQQAELYRSTAFEYIWDDHDSGGNNVSRGGVALAAARAAYELYVPHYPLATNPGPAPIYHSFTVGRVKFIVTDLRSDKDGSRKRDDANKSMMGAVQKAWFKQQLLEANGKYPLICWVSSVPWIGEWGTNYYPIKTNVYGFIHHTNKALFRSEPRRSSWARTYPGDEDHWSVYSTERREIADFIKSNHIQGVCILHGDAHMLAADDGTHSDYATGGGAPVPVMGAAPLDKDPSIKGGPYSQGVYRVANAQTGEGGFGLVTVTDTGREIRVRFSGRNNKDQEKISLQFKVPVGRDALFARRRD
jgi:prolyl oligopeptidase